MSPIYWKPKYGTRSTRHKAWVKQQAKREAAFTGEPKISMRERFRRLFNRRP